MEEAENLNSRAARIAVQITGQELPKPEPPPVCEQNLAAVALGKLGASKGGKARAEKLSKEQKIEIAKKGALARWVGE